MENNFKYIVYQTINLVNNKIYIGVHKTNPTIFDGYIGNGVNINYPSTYMNPKYPFQFAVKKYGTANFRRTTLYTFDNERDAYIKEEELVNLDFVQRNDTYNCILGGNVRPLFYYRHKIYQFDSNGNLVKEWEDVYECSSFLETWKESIYQAIQSKNRLYGYYWSFDSEINVSEYSNPNNPQKVYKYTKAGKCIEIYQSITQAAKQNNYEPSALYNRIKEGALTKGYYYSLTLYDEFAPAPKLQLKGKIIYVYDLDGNFIEAVEYKNIHSYLGVCSNKRISTYIKTKTPIEGKQLRLEKFDKIDPYVKKNKSKVVLVYKLNGEFIGEFESINKVCRELNLDNSTVNKVLRGVNKSTKGYTLKIKDIV